MRAFLASLLVGVTLVPFAVSAQGLTRLSNRAGYHPVTENGWVVWTEGSSPDALQLLLWDGANTVVLDEAAVGALAGWPDVDASGRVAYVKVVGGRYELMLWDGLRTLQLTRSDLPGSDVDLGTPSSDLKGGFPRIAIGDVVFSDADGNVFLYEAAEQHIRSVSMRPDQRVARTTREDRTLMQQAGIKPVFHYDGYTIVWMHRAPGGNTSELTIYRADADDDYTPRSITSFIAATPQDMNTAIAGAAFDPYFVACGPEIAWMYRAPGTGPAVNIPARFAQYAAALNEVAVGHYDGEAARQVAQGDIAPLDLALSDGHLVWIESEETDDGEFTRIQSYRGGGTSTLALIPEPPAQAEADEKFWVSPGGLHAVGSEVLWFQDEVRCEPMANLDLPGIGSPCGYHPTARTGLFTRAGGATPRRIFRQGDLLLGGSFDAGRYVWRDEANRIRTTELIAGLGGDGGLLQITDLLRVPDIPVAPDDPRAQLVDVFALRAARGGGECAPGGATGDEIQVWEMTLSVTAESGVLPSLTDIAALRLYVDVNENRSLDEQDELLHEATEIGARQTLPLEEPLTVLPGDEIHFLVEMELKDADELCPCNEYRVALTGADVDAGEVSVQGATEGALVLPNAVIEPVWGDAQAALPLTRLADPLGFRIDNLPERCVEGARFRLVNGVSGDDAVIAAQGEEGSDLELDFAQNGDGLEAEVAMTLGSREGTYLVEASPLYPADAECEPPTFTFVANAGSFVLQVLDANDPQFVDATPDGSHPDYDSWTVALTDDLARLSDGGEIRSGTTADGLSALLLRARLIGLSEAPAGEVTFTMTGDDDGFLSPGVGETIPGESGAATISAHWTMTPAGPIAVALYTPPRHLTPASAADRAVHFRATYQMPGATEPSEDERDVLVRRPPILLTHGMWSGPEAWGPAYTNQDPRFETFLVDYSARAAENFDALGGVMREHIESVRDGLNGRGIAVTQINVVAHSMGGLITRDYINESRGANFRRPDTFGQGDIYEFVTMGTPHHGSPIAWLTVVMRDPEYDWESDPNLGSMTQNFFAGVAQDFIEELNQAGMDVWSGAVDAMCPGSPALLGLGPTHVPSHTIRAWHYDSHAADLGWSTAYEFFSGLVDGIVEDAQQGLPPTPMGLVNYALQFGAGLAVEGGIQGLYASQRTDYLVTLESQSGGITQGYRFDFPDTLHSAAPGADGETTSPEIAAHMYWVLTQDPGDLEVFASTLPAPIVEADYVTCQ